MTSSPRKFFSELKRRNVYKVAVAYAVIGWLVLQVAAVFFPTFEAPGWVMKVFVAAVVAGFPLALVIAWAFEMTPDGMKRTENVAPHEHIPQWSRRKFASLVIGVALLAVALLTFQLWRNHRAAAANLAPEKSIAVLPFENLSRDPDNGWFSEGIEEEILARLARVSDLKVISHTSTQRYKSSPDDLPQIAHRLGVSHVLEGSVQKSADQVRVTVQLIRASTDSHLWAETYDRNLTDIFAVESEIARSVADKLQAKLTGSEASAIAAHPTQDAEAHRLYLLGRSFWNKRTAPDLHQAITYFQQAMDKDPAYALAYVGLADAYVLLSGFSAASPSESLPKAKAAARKALELDDSLGEAHASLAEAIFSYDLDIAAATREFQRAIALAPNYATAHQWYAESALSSQGHFDEAIAEMRHALELDPLSVIISADVGTMLVNARRYDEAIVQLRKTLQMDPKFYYGHWNLGQALELQGQFEEAKAEYQKAVKLSGGDPLPLALLGHLYGAMGDKDKAREILKELHRPRPGIYVTSYTYALVHIGLGETDAAFRELDNTYEDRDGYSIAFIRVDPMCDPIRDDPRFQALLKKVFGPERP